MDEYLYNILCISICLFALTAYASSTYFFTFFFPLTSAKMQMVKTTKSALVWLKKHREKTDSPNVTVAVQTIRNSIFVAIFTGGATFLSAVTLLNSFPSIHDPYQKIRTVILSFILFLSFLSWASVLRSSSHLGYMTGVLKYHEPHEVEQGENRVSSTPLTEPLNNQNSQFLDRQADFDISCIDYDALISTQEQQRMYHERSVMYMVIISFRLVLGQCIFIHLYAILIYAFNKNLVFYYSYTFLYMQFRFSLLIYLDTIRLICRWT